MANEEWLTPNIRYDLQQGYVMLQISSLPLPAQLVYLGATFEAKTELHVSLLTTTKLAAYFTNTKRAQIKVAAHIRAFLRRQPVTFKRFLPYLYHCKHKDAQTLVVAAELTNISELFESLRAAFPELKTLPNPAPHVTLYKYNHQFGIGIQNAQELSLLCELVPEDELINLRQLIV